MEIDRAPASLSNTERVLAELWQEALQMAMSPGRDDDFFALGGDSMTMAMVEFRIVEELGVQLAPGATLGASMLCDLAALVDGTRAQSTAEADDIPLTAP